MKMRKTFLYASVCTAALLCGISLHKARADCGDGEQCSVTDGSTKTLTGGFYKTIGTSPADLALYAEGDASTIIGLDLTLENPFLFPAFIAEARQGATIRLNNSTITGLGGAFTSENSRIHLFDTSITITGDGTYAIEAHDTSLVTFTASPETFVDIATQGDYSRAVFAGEKAHIALTGMRLVTHGTMADGVVAENEASISLNRSSISIESDWAYGVHSADNAEITLHGSDIDVSGQDSIGLAAEGEALLSDGTKRTAILFENGTITLKDEGVAVNAIHDAHIVIRDSNIENRAEWSYYSSGLYVSDRGEISVTNGTIANMGRV